MAPRSELTTESRILSSEEGRALFDQQCRLRLGMSGAEFIRRWDAGEYEDLKDVPENNDVLYISLLLPFGRQ